MALRNFYVKARIDGRETELAGGPRRKDGGMTIRVLQRDEGEKLETVVIRCWEDCGTLVTDVEVSDKIVASIRTRR